jgi:hypothetical protein
MTLLELILVLGIMSLILAMTWPLLERPLAYERLRRSADLVMSEWITARVDAMRTGTHRVFRFREKTGEYELEGEERPEPPALPEGIVFAETVKEVDPREEIEGGGVTDGDWREIWFYFDGTTSDVPQLLLRNEYGMGIRLTLRGLTGIASVDTDVPDAEETEAAP